MSRTSSPTASVPRRIAVNALLMLTCAAVLYPVLWVLKMALTPGQAFSMDPGLIPPALTLENFATVLFDGRTSMSAWWTEVILADDGGVVLAPDGARDFGGGLDLFGCFDGSDHRLLEWGGE